MPYIGVGLVTFIVGLLLFLGTNPDTRTLEWPERFGLVLLAGGAVVILIGMVTHVVQVNRADRRRQ